MPGRNSVVMRGISTGSAEYYTDSQVAVYLDDQPMTSISQQVDVRLIDIARIEVLPGPQGTLFGSSSQSGTLRYITNKPDTTGFSSQIDLEGGVTKGGEESYDISGHVNIPLGDSVAIRAVGYYAVEGGYIDNVLGMNLAQTEDNADVVEKNFNDYTTTGGRIAARWQISPKWESTLSLISQYSDADGSWDSDPEVGDYKIVRFVDEMRDDDWYQASANFKGDLGFAELSVTASYFDRDIVYEWDNMTYENWRTAYYGRYNELYLYDTNYLNGSIFNDQKQNRWAYEVRLTSQGESRFQWMAGAFYEDVYDWWHYGAAVPNLTSTTAWTAAQYYACYYAYDTLCPLADTDIYYSNIFEKSVRQNAVFGEMTFGLTDRWSVTGGARWFEYNRHEFESFEVPKGLPLFDQDADGNFFLMEPTISSGKDEDVVYKFGTEFHFNDDRMAYLLYSQGFRLGGKNSARAAATGVYPAEYAPDKLENYELGFKSKWLDGRVLLNVSLFFMEWSDIQLSDDGGDEDDPWWVRGTYNGGKAEQKGIEFNGKWAVTDNLSFEGSAFLAEPEFSEDTFEPNGIDVIEAGTPMPDSPEEKFWVAAEYRFPGFLGQNGDFWTRMSYSYQSEFWNSITAIQEDNRDQIVPSSSTSTLQFGFSHNNGWETALVIRNLFDEDGVSWMSTTDYGSAVLYPNTGFDDPRFRYVRTLQRPRSISLSFSKKW
jgi:outer membrane receptor protein involved in Fe transport